MIIIRLGEVRIMRCCVPTFNSAGWDDFESAGQITDENDEDALRQCGIQIGQHVVVTPVGVKSQSIHTN